MKQPVKTIPMDKPADSAGSELHLRRLKLGFRPAFLDFATMHIYPSCPADGAVKETIVAGFERDGFFYTHRAAERACGEWTVAS